MAKELTDRLIERIVDDFHFRRELRRLNLDEPEHSGHSEREQRSGWVTTPLQRVEVPL